MSAQDQPTASSLDSLAMRMPRLLAGIAVVAIALLGLLAWLPGVQPESLWLDDQWMAVLARDGSPGFLLQERIPAAPGFVLLLRGASALLGGGDWALQAVPLAAAFLAILLAGWAAGRATGSGGVAVAASALLAVSPYLVVYSVRVKQYTLDACVVAALLVLALGALRRSGPGVVRRLAIAAAVALPFSFATILPGGIMVNVVGGAVAWRARWGAGSRPDARAALWSVAAFDLWAAAFWGLVMRGRTNPSILDHWRRFFLPLDDLSSGASFLAGRGLRLFTGAFPAGMPWLALLVPLGLVALARRQELRPLALALAGIYLAAAAAAGLRLYPMGGGRTDLYAAPATVLLAAAGAWELVRRVRWGTPALGLAAAAGFLLVRPGLDPAYPPSGARAIVERAGEKVAEADGLVVYPWSNYAVGYYGPWPVELVPVRDSTNGFYVHLRRPRTLVLHETLAGMRFDEDPAVVEEQLRPFLAGAPERLAYLAVKGPLEPHAWIVRTIVSSGYRLVEEAGREGAILLIYERRADPADEATTAR